jgi:hypothetical protein
MINLSPTLALEELKPRDELAVIVGVIVGKVWVPVIPVVVAVGAVVTVAAVAARGAVLKFDGQDTRNETRRCRHGRAGNARTFLASLRSLGVPIRLAFAMALSGCPRLTNTARAFGGVLHAQGRRIGNSRARDGCRAQFGMPRLPPRCRLDHRPFEQKPLHTMAAWPRSSPRNRWSGRLSLQRDCAASTRRCFADHSPR